MEEERASLEGRFLWQGWNLSAAKRLRQTACSGPVRLSGLKDDCRPLSFTSYRPERCGFFGLAGRYIAFHRSMSPIFLRKNLVVIRSALLVSALVWFAGCALIRDTLELSDKAVQFILPLGVDSKPVDPVDLQGKIMRYADNFLAMFNGEIDKLPEVPGSVSERHIRSAKIAYNFDILGIATGPNPLANLLDMVSYVTLTRLTVADYWMPKVFGNAALPLAKNLESAETEIWRIADVALLPQQQNELRTAIHAYHQANPDPKTLRAIHGMGFASAIANISKNGTSVRPHGQSSVFDMLGIDPLSALTPATRELAQTKLFGERALFIAKRMPELIRWETELLTLDTLELPQVGRLNDNAAQFASAMDRVSRVAERLPADLGAERERIVTALTSQTCGMTTLADQVDRAFGSGTRMADATNTTLNSFKNLLAQLKASPSNDSGEPFRIQDYTAAAVEIGKTLQRLETLLDMARTVPEPDQSKFLEHFTQEAQAGGKEFVDYLFLRSLLLLGSVCVGVLMTVLAYRLIVARWLRGVSRLANASGSGPDCRK
ncbi:MULTISPECIES: hypothetical protein [Methylococcus]|uniref:Lipoprotein n=1 Tax=Methylococcus capsulatus TaxID=414 RepID=A0ABZ2F696_METCP|nr:MULTISPECIES: hypothetical protein [Methylococcus]MDF9393740.1 hypothetical protein [Methylococcus capsulatus]